MPARPNSTRAIRELTEQVEAVGGGLAFTDWDPQLYAGSTLQDVGDVPDVYGGYRFTQTQLECYGFIRLTTGFQLSATGLLQVALPAAPAGQVYTSTVSGRLHGWGQAYESTAFDQPRVIVGRTGTISAPKLFFTRFSDGVNLAANTYTWDVDSYWQWHADFPIKPSA